MAEVTLESLAEQVKALEKRGQRWKGREIAMLSLLLLGLGSLYFWVEREIDETRKRLWEIESKHSHRLGIETPMIKTSMIELVDWGDSKKVRAKLGVFDNGTCHLEFLNGEGELGAKLGLAERGDPRCQDSCRL